MSALPETLDLPAFPPVLHRPSGRARAERMARDERRAGVEEAAEPTVRTVPGVRGEDA